MTATPLHPARRADPHKIAATARPADLLPRPSQRFFRFFAWYARRYTAKHLNAVRLTPETHATLGSPNHAPPSPSNSELRVSNFPNVIYLNHPAWWDPMLCVLLASHYFPHHAHYAPIDAAALQKYPFFKRLGFFGIQKDSAAGARTLLRTLAALQQQPNAMLWITAQGTFTDPRQRPVTLKPGLALALRDRPNLTLLPLAVEYTFWQERQPEALLHAGAPISAQHLPPDLHDRNAALEAALQSAQDTLAQHAIARNPAHFHTLLQGRAGIHPVYDAFRRTLAALRGKPFTPRHAPTETAP